MAPAPAPTIKPLITAIGFAALIASSWLLPGCGGGAPATSHPPLLDPAHDSNDADATRTALTLELFDADPARRTDAIAVLTDAQVAIDPSDRRDLLATAVTDPNEHVRAEAVQAVGSVGSSGDAASHELLAYALGDPRITVRAAAIDAFVEIGGDDSARALGLALSDPDVSLREEAVYALGQIGGPTSIDLLRQATVDPDATIRQSAEERLVRLLSRPNGPSHR